MSDDSTGSTVRRTIVAEPRAAATTSPMRDRTSSRTDSPNHPAAIASSRDTTHARSASVSRHAASTAFRRPVVDVDVPGSRFAADGVHTVEQLCAVVDVHRTVGLGRHHAVVGHDRE